MKRAVRRWMSVASAPWTLVFAMPVCVLAIRAANAFIPDVNSDEAKFRRSIEAIVRNDPPTGTAVGLNPDRLKRKTILIYTSTCDCSHQNLQRLKSIVVDGCDLRVMVPFQKSDSELKKVLRKQSQAILFDEEGAIGDRLNAKFAPRAYLLNSSGKLLWVNPEFELSWVRLIEEAKKHLGD